MATEAFTNASQKLGSFALLALFLVCVQAKLQSLRAVNVPNCLVARYATPYQFVHKLYLPTPLCYTGVIPQRILTPVWKCPLRHWQIDALITNALITNRHGACHRLLPPWWWWQCFAAAQA